MRVSYDLLLPLYTRFKKMHTENPRIRIILSVLNLAGIEFPITLSQIKKFDTLNDISINVYTQWEGDCRYDSPTERGANT